MKHWKYRIYGQITSIKYIKLIKCCERTVIGIKHMKHFPIDQNVGNF